VQTHVKGTSGYRAPEYLLGKATDMFAVDMWAIGMILLEMLHKRDPLRTSKGISIGEELYNLFVFFGPPPNH
jgi:serine/threonine protein kinase